MDNKTKFFILYPRIAEEEAKSVVDEINYRLGTNYKLWSYAEVDDMEDYFEHVIQPEIENSGIILAMVAKNTTSDVILKKGCKLASDSGEQQIIPIKIGKGRVKAKDWAFGRILLISMMNLNESSSLRTCMVGSACVRKATFTAQESR